MFKLPDKKRNILFVSVGLFCLITAFVLIQSFKGKFEQEAPEVSGLPSMTDSIDVGARRDPAASGQSPSAFLPGNTSSVWVVYVTGAVKKPGVYEIPAYSRIYSALEAAGGFSLDADQGAVNLASMAEDGMHIRFLFKNEAGDSQCGETQRLPESPQSSGRAVRTEVNALRLLNLNYCTVDDLQTLPGIGKKTAKLIVSYRKTHGNFARVEDLLLIKGIGSKKFDAVKDLVTVVP